MEETNPALIECILRAGTSPRKITHWVARMKRLILKSHRRQLCHNTCRKFLLSLSLKFGALRDYGVVPD